MESDESLCERVQRGDLAAFDVLYERYETRLFGFIVGYLDDAAEAEDVFHEAFLAMLRKRPDVSSPGGSFRGWLFQTARNACLNRLRSRSRGAEAERRMTHEPAVQLVSAEEALVHRDASKALDAAVSKLPDSLSEVYRLRASGMSYEEMAQVLEVPLGTVKSRIHEMVQRLQEEMRPWTAR